MNEEMEMVMSRLNVEKKDEWSKWRETIPAIHFPSDWAVRIIPPAHGAIARFLVILDEKEYVSIYLDCYDRLGYFGAPYWEVYPFDGDVGRCAMEDTATLLEMIAKSIADHKAKA